MKVLKKFVFHSIEQLRVLTQDDHMRKRRTTEDRCCQAARAGEFKGRYTESAEVLCGQITCIQKHVFGLNWAYPPSYRYPR